MFYPHLTTFTFYSNIQKWRAPHTIDRNNGHSLIDSLKQKKTV